jgi:transposase-like protein
MKPQRRQYSADWKAKVALEAIKGQRTVQEIASHYEVHPTLVPTLWPLARSWARTQEKARRWKSQGFAKIASSRLPPQAESHTERERQRCDPSYSKFMG